MIVDWRVAEAGPKTYLMSWFGSFLATDVRTDWLVHRPLDADGALDDLIYVGPGTDGPGTAWTSCLWQTTSRPRRLPAIDIAPGPDRRQLLRCADPVLFPDLNGHYFTAIPGGQIEINRIAAFDWESFLPLDQADLASLQALLRHGRLSSADHIEHPLSLVEGHRLVGGGATINIAGLPVITAGTELVVDDIEGNPITLRLS